MKIFTLFILMSFNLYSTEIKVVGDENYLPIIGLSNDQPSGFLVERLTKISDLSGIKFNLVLYPWARAISIAQKADVAIIGISKNSEREKLFDYSDPIYTDSILIVVKKGKEFQYNNFEDLKGKVIGAQIGASLGDEFDKYITTHKLQIDRDRARESRLLKILHQRIDVALIGNGLEGFNQILDSNPNLKNSRDQFTILKKSLNEDKMYIAFDKKLNKANELSKINAAIKKLNFK